MPTVYKLIPEKQTFFSGSGTLLSGGKLYTYAAGTSTPKDTYTEIDGATTNANPIILNARGEVPNGVFGTTGAYKLVLKDASDVTLWTRDNVYGEGDPANLDVSTLMSEWIVSTVVATRTGATTFTVPGDLTKTYEVNRRVRCIDASTLYGSILSSSYSVIDDITTVTVTLDSGALTASLTRVDYSVVSAASMMNDAKSITFTQAGTGAVSTTVEARGQLVIYASDFYSEAQRSDVSAGTATVDVTTALQAAITRAKAVQSPHFILDPGTHLVSDTIQFDLPDDATITFLGKLKSSVSDKSAVIIGKAGGNSYRITARGLKVERSAIDYTGTSVGIELLNLAWCDVDVRGCVGFRVGVKAHGNTYGFTYNNVALGHLHDNRTNLQLAVSNSAGGGYCNENNFFGGSLNHTTTYDVATYNGVNLDITHDATSPINNNRFYGLSMEDAHPSSTNTVAAIINGESNWLIVPRIERIVSGSTYQIQFTANSIRCGILGNPFAMLDSNINNLGSQNEYTTSEGRIFSAGTPLASNKAVLKLQSKSTSTARLLQLLDSGGTEVAYMTGEGNLWSIGWLRTRGSPSSGETNTVTFGANTQMTVGPGGAAAATPANPAGYLRVFVGTTEYVIPYYQKN